MAAIRAPLRSALAPFVPLERPSRAEAQRLAAVAFLRATTLGWTKRDVAEWLVCHYAPAAVQAGCDPGPREDDDAGFTRVDVVALEHAVLDARARLTRLLSELTVPERAAAIGRASIAAGSVAALRDARGTVAHAAVCLPRMRLFDRVASLFVVRLPGRSTLRRVRGGGVRRGARAHRRVREDRLPPCGGDSRYVSFCFRRSLTSLGFACPFVFFITRPTSAPNTLALPPL